MQKTTIEAVKKMLVSMDYPVTKSDLIRYAKENKMDEKLINQLNGLQDKEFMTSGDVMRELDMEEDEKM